MGEMPYIDTVDWRRDGVSRTGATHVVGHLERVAFAVVLLQRRR